MGDDGKDPIPARYIWTVEDSPRARLDIAPTDTASAYSFVSVVDSASSYRYSVDNGDPIEGKPERIGPLKPGTHTLRVWADNDNAPAVASWQQSPPPAFGSTTVKVNVNTSGWHTLHANATDPLNRPDQVGAHFNFYADYTAPTAIIKDPPPAVQYENITALDITQRRTLALTI